MRRKLGRYPHQNGMAVARRRLGRIQPTPFALNCMHNIELRRRVQIGLNEGKAENSLVRAVFLNRLGAIRDRSFEGQHHCAASIR